MKLRKTTLYCAALVAAVLSTDAGVAVSREFGYNGWGPRAGFSSDPDQIFFGAHLDYGDIVPGLGFRPNATIGFGNDVTIVSINPDIAYRLLVEGAGWFYFGGLLAFQYMNYDVPDRYDDKDVDDSDTELGLHILGGLELQSKPVLLELNIGLDEAPDLKAAIGYTFR